MVKDAAAAKTVGGKTADAVFDVAISFPVADEKIASQIKSGLAGLNVFFYPHRRRQADIRRAVLDIFESRLRQGKLISLRSERDCCEQSEVQVASHHPSIRNCHIFLPQDERSDMHGWLHLPLDD